MFYLAASQHSWFRWFTVAREAFQTFTSISRGLHKHLIIGQEKNLTLLSPVNTTLTYSLLLKSKQHARAISKGTSFLFISILLFNLIAIKSFLSFHFLDPPLEFFFFLCSVDCESHSPRLWFHCKVRHMAHSEMGRSSINQSWMQCCNVLLITSMGMGEHTVCCLGYPLRQSDSSCYLGIGPLLAEFWALLDIAPRYTLGEVLWENIPHSWLMYRVISICGQHFYMLIYLKGYKVW